MNTASTKGQAVRRGMTLTFAKVVEQHRQWGEPLILWRDGKVVHEYIDQDLEVAEESDAYNSTPEPSTNRSPD
ncbi:MAG: hypothetical protein KAI66_05830 [Lentisphaeria bacterium]|nr:hypothetical protein [Lentisphaeria bacterium]